MKRILLSLVALISLSANAQTAKPSKAIKATKPQTEIVQLEEKVSENRIAKLESKVDSLLSRIDTLLLINNSWLEQVNIDLSLKNRYKLYQTENIYQLLELDTKTGKIKQIQWSLDKEKEFTVSVNSEDLSTIYSYGSNSFELYPTKNMYQFILIDKTDGRKWHVQWGTESSKRWIRRIW